MKFNHHLIHEIDTAEAIYRPVSIFKYLPATYKINAQGELLYITFTFKWGLHMGDVVYKLDVYESTATISKNMSLDDVENMLREYESEMAEQLKDSPIAQSTKNGIPPDLHHIPSLFSTHEFPQTRDSIHKALAEVIAQ